MGKECLGRFSPRSRDIFPALLSRPWKISPVHLEQRRWRTLTNSEEYKSRFVPVVETDQQSWDGGAAALVLEGKTTWFVNHELTQQALICLTRSQWMTSCQIFENLISFRCQDDIYPAKINGNCLITCVSFWKRLFPSGLWLNSTLQTLWPLSFAVAVQTAINTTWPHRKNTMQTLEMFQADLTMAVADVRVVSQQVAGD